MALDSLRRWARSWVALVFIGVIILSFAVFGLGDIARFGGGDFVAKVGKTQVDTEQFATAYNRYVRSRMIENPSFTPADARAELAGQGILYQLVSQAALQEKARRAGLSASDAMVRDAIRSLPEFRGPTGAFDPVIYEGVLAQSGYSRSRFEAQLRSDLTGDMVRRAVTAGLEIPPAYFNAMFEFEAERRTAAYFLLTAAAAGPVEAPSDTDLETIYEENRQTFIKPAYRTVNPLIDTPDVLSEIVEVTDADIEALYNRRNADFVKPVRRAAKRLVYSSQAEAQAAIDAIKGGQSMEELAEAQGRDPSDLRFGPLARPGQAGLIDTAFAEAIFVPASEGLIEEPVQGRLGWAVLDVEIVPEEIITLEEAREALARQVRAEKADTQMDTIRNDAEDLLAQGEELGAIADSVNVPVTDLPPLDREGLDKAGERVDAVANLPTLLQEIFALDLNFESDIIDLSAGGFAIAVVVEEEPTQIPDLSEIRDEVSSAYQATRINERLQASLEAARTAGASDLTALAGQFGVDIIETEPFMRSELPAGFGPQVVSQIFASAPQTIVSGPDATGEALVVAIPLTILGPDQTTAEPFRAQLNTLLSETVGQELETQYVQALQTAFETRVNQRAVDAITDPTYGQGHGFGQF
ncbi:MAG: SurA N-terminal domain-containing protein [Pseudomonadota bacterium]